MYLLSTKTLNKFAEEMSISCSQPVKDFIDGYVPVYEGNAGELADNQCKEAYANAVQGCKDWVRYIQIALLANDKKPSSQCATLYFPDRTVEVEVLDGNESINYTHPYNNLQEPEMITTPIGKMNYLTYHLILEVKDNPVQLLYRHLVKLRDNIHNILVMNGEHLDVLEGDWLLDDYHIVDVIGVHKMDVMLGYVKSFLEGDI